MPPITDAETALRRIAALARDAAARDDIPSALKPVLAEIIDHSVQQSGDTPEPSDIARTENQSL